ATVREILEAEGIEVVVGANDVRISKTDNGFELAPRTGADPIAGSHLLVAVGRRPNTDDLSLEAAGVQTDARGFIVVDDQLKTNLPPAGGEGRVQRQRAAPPPPYQRFGVRPPHPPQHPPARGERPRPPPPPPHRPAAGTRRHDRRPGPRVGPQGVARQAAD